MHCSYLIDLSSIVEPPKDKQSTHVRHAIELYRLNLLDMSGDVLSWKILSEYSRQVKVRCESLSQSDVDLLLDEYESGFNLAERVPLPVLIPPDMLENYREVRSTIAFSGFSLRWRCGCLFRQCSQEYCICPKTEAAIILGEKIIGRTSHLYMISSCDSS